jgi:nucleoside-diphosphate-sugar epimerase
MERFVITGPTGWIGQAVLARLAAELGDNFASSVTAFASRARHLPVPGTTGIAVRALADMVPQDLDGAHLIHLAYLTKERADSLGERDFTAQNILIDDCVLDAALRQKPRSVFVASSGAAAYALSDWSLNPYGLCKVRQEQRFLEFARNRQVPTLVGRVFNIAGPYINKLESYAISNMLMQARDNGKIRINASHLVSRSFMHVDDLAKLILSAGRHCHDEHAPVDLCGAQVVEMADIATSVASCFSSSISIERPEISHSYTASYLGNFTCTHILAARLGVSLQPFLRQVRDTWEWMQGLEEGRVG